MTPKETSHYVHIKHGLSTRSGIYRVLAVDRRDAMKKLAKAGMWGNALTSLEFLDPRATRLDADIHAIVYLPSEDGNLT